MSRVNQPQAINHRGSISAYDEHADSRNCDSHENPSGKKSANINNLYGSTPQLTRHRFSSTYNLGRNDFSRHAGRTIDIFRTDPQSINQLDFHDFGDGFEPGYIANDYVGPAMELVSATFFFFLFCQVFRRECPRFRNICVSRFCIVTSETKKKKSLDRLSQLKLIISRETISIRQKIIYMYRVSRVFGELFCILYTGFNS